MPSSDSAPYNGDDKLYAKESRAYYLYGWSEIRQNEEPEGVVQAIPGPVRPDDGRSPYRIYADTLMQDIIADYVPTPAAVVDIGCGRGHYARLFKDFTGEYHGVDIFDYPKWDEAKRDAENWPLHVAFHQRPGEEVGSLEVSANFSLSSSALEHVEDPDAVARGLAHIMQAGSYGLHIVPGPWTLMTYGKHGWRRFSAQRLRAMFEDAGFECVRLYRLGGIPSSMLHFFWITGLEDGGALQNITLSALPFIVYRANSVLRYAGARTSRLTGPAYRALLRPALRLDRFLPRMASGYAILIRRP